MSRTSTRPTALSCAAVILVIAIAGTCDAGGADETSPKSLKVVVGNRLYPNFQETIDATMQTRTAIGDTDFSFEAIEFYPHFAIVDSTKKVVSLSDDPKNPAFRIRVYQNDEAIDSTWAFYGIKAPHYAPTSYLTFTVVEFEYRGVVYGKKDEKGRKDEKSKKEEGKVHESSDAKEE